jgi:hypothetical protein
MQLGRAVTAEFVKSFGRRLLRGGSVGSGRASERRRGRNPRAVGHLACRERYGYFDRAFRLATAGGRV